MTQGSLLTIDTNACAATEVENRERPQSFETRRIVSITKLSRVCDRKPWLLSGCHNRQIAVTG